MPARPFRNRLAALGIRQRLTRGGTAGDNAHLESFFQSLKADLVYGSRFLTEAELRTQLRDYLWHYHYQRLHSTLCYRSPVDFERRAV